LNDSELLKGLICFLNRAESIDLPWAALTVRNHSDCIFSYQEAFSGFKVRRDYLCDNLTRYKRMRFSAYTINPEIKRSISESGFTRPTDIQFKAIPPILVGDDVLAIAQTGTGKTAAFAIPVLHSC